MPAEPAARLADNVLRFCRALRAAGLPIGPGRGLDAARAAARVGVRRRDDFYWTLHASLVGRAEESPMFDLAFRAFWSPPGAPDPPEGAAPAADGAPSDPEPGARRIAEALRLSAGEAPTDGAIRDAASSASPRETLRKRDFDRMSAAEFALAQAAARALARRLAPLPTRRLRTDPRGARVDPRGALRAAARTGAPLPLPRRRRRRAPPPLVLLCDISGSMGRYSRVLLHFAHALARDDGVRVRAFVFGTRLTDVSRHLRGRDPDAALDAVATAVDDWSGGTRIGAALAAFNRGRPRGAAGRGAVVLLVTDGLDREAADGIAVEADRLRRSCRRLVWLNPLLRYAGFEPRAAGVRALLPHVDSHRPVHDLDSLAALADALAGERGALL